MPFFFHWSFKFAVAAPLSLPSLHETRIGPKTADRPKESSSYFSLPDISVHYQYDQLMMIMQAPDFIHSCSPPAQVSCSRNGDSNQLLLPPHSPPPILTSFRFLTLQDWIWKKTRQEARIIVSWHWFLGLASDQNWLSIESTSRFSGNPPTLHQS